MVSFAGLQFIFRFLILFLIIYYVSPVKYRDIVLLAGSYIFYAFGDLYFIGLLLLLTVVNYYAGRAITKHSECFELHEWQKAVKKRYLIAIAGLDITTLVVFKVLAVVAGTEYLPLGISFYLFKMISYQVDLYRGNAKKNVGFVETAVYFSMFPQIVSGPVMRFHEGLECEERTYTLEQFEDGLKYFIIGLGMKVLLADRLAILWKDLQMIGYQSISTPLAWLGAAGFSLQLYFDFWGYSLMSSGILLMLGFDFIENFHHPYASLSVSEFYRRWHITLGSFFRDYVYIPMGGSRCRKNRVILNLTVVWLLTGIWHGSGINFVIWGIVLLLLILMERFLYGEKLGKHVILSHIYLIIVIVLSWVIFAITDLKQLWIYFTRLFPFLPGEAIAVNSQDIVKYGLAYGKYFVVGIVLCIPAVFHFLEEHRKHPVVIAGLAGIFWYCVYVLSISSGNPFMYLKF